MTSVCSITSGLERGRGWPGASGGASFRVGFGSFDQSFSTQPKSVSMKSSAFVGRYGLALDFSAFGLAFAATCFLEAGPRCDGAECFLVVGGAVSSSDISKLSLSLSCSSSSSSSRSTFACDTLLDFGG